MLEIFKSGWFWAAISATIALITLFIKTMPESPLRYYFLQRKLNSERSLYDLIPDPINPVHDDQSITIQNYVKQVNKGMAGIERLPSDQKTKARDKLRDLISSLRTTHETLVKSFSIFSTDDVKMFFEQFDKYKQDFETSYQSGTISDKARTHCHDVIQAVNDLATLPDNTRPEWYDIAAINQSIIARDQEVIVPLMTETLDKT